MNQKDFIVISISREDVTNALNLPEEAGRIISDNEMRQIAARMAESLIDPVYNGAISEAVLPELRKKLEV